MPGRKVLCFTGKKKEFTGLLTGTGIPGTAAKVLVFPGILLWRPPGISGMPVSVNRQSASRCSISMGGGGS